ncbi:hypothetical protein [Pelomonas cellulosilytica]|uniref:Uncharacterized protein n=1 Tax=Pelomonas cellulosilytica TaxID=2906762 RepID=A0ABS8XUL8_9BURK|nr:hypothetical protein [Pelomonas sp. P8]MCE4554316.1 hypothetical protein [Pelomonas sp. P8]
MTEGPTKFYVVPVLDLKLDPPDLREKVVTCRYFNENWDWVEGNVLTTVQPSDVVRFVNPESVPQQVLTYLMGHRRCVPDPTVSLFAATAKTLGDTNHLPNNFLAAPGDGGMFIDIPVKTRRGVVLVFRRPQRSDGYATELIATTDPEIQNGSSKT